MTVPQDGRWRELFALLARVQQATDPTVAADLGAEWRARTADLDVPTRDIADQVMATGVAAASQRVSGRVGLSRWTHDTRGALAVVLGNCEMLQDGVWGPLTPAQAKALETIGRQITRLQCLVDEAGSLGSPADMPRDGRP